MTRIYTNVHEYFKVAAMPGSSARQAGIGLHSLCFNSCVFVNILAIRGEQV
jgi:hypothetical protein